MVRQNVKIQKFVKLNQADKESPLSAFAMLQ